MEIKEAQLGSEKELARDFWLPLGQQMENYSELNILKDEAVERAIEGFREQLKEGTHRHFFLEENSERRAFITVTIGVRESREKGKYLEIVNLYTKEEFRSRGYGTLLVEHAKSLAREQGCDFVRTSAEWDNKAARNFYEKNGFREKQVKYVQKLD